MTGPASPSSVGPRGQLRDYAFLSIAAALLTIALKVGAWWITGSVGLLADALESSVNLVSALMLLWALTYAARPPDRDHPYGHEKIEYFSSGSEGTLVLVAAALIIYKAVGRLLSPEPVESVNVGLALAILAALINLVAARLLLRFARNHQSIALEADSHHLMTDVWTSAGVVVGVGMVNATGWLWLDPVIALGVGAMILLTGTRLLLRSAQGLMDQAISGEEIRQVEEILDSYRRHGVRYHALRSRRAGPRRFVSFHVQTPGTWTVQRGHDLLEEMEARIRRELPRTSVFTHLEPIEDPVSWQDEELDRPEPDRDG